MRTRYQAGAVNALLLPLIVAVLLLVAALVFGAWAYSGKQDYKNNVDSKIASAVAAAKLSESKVKDAQFAQESKDPLKTYTGPEAYGKIIVEYPKTWSGYVSDTSGQSPFVDGYFSPGEVPSASQQSSVFALRVQVVQESYSDELTQYLGMQKTGQATVVPYSLPKLPGVVGSRITGSLGNQKQGIMIALPLRDKTLLVWTESTSFQSDFDNIILANLSFSP